MPISRLLPAVVAVALVSLSQCVNAQTPLPQFYDSNFQACLSEQASRNGWTFAEQVIALSCPNRGIAMLGGIDRLVNLSELDVSNNRLQGVWEVGMLPKLTRLNLGGNGLVRSNDLGQTLSRLPGLKSLNLNGINIGSINNLNGLNNPMTGQPLPLQELDLGNTRLQDAQNGKSLEFLRNMPTLKKLSVAGNGISNADGIVNAREMEELDLSDNSLPYLGALTQFTNLKRLNLAGNSKIAVPEIAMLIRQNPGLTSINLSGIAIGNINNLGPLVDSRTGQPLNLTELDLGNTGIKDTSGEAGAGFLRPFVNLRKLNLANNGLRETYPLDLLLQLEEVDLSGNQLSSAGGLSLLHNLTRVNLSGNRNLRFDELSNTLLPGNPKLVSLGLNGIRIGQNTQWLGAISGNSQQAAAWVELDLGNTGIDGNSINQLQTLVNLQRLNLADNGFSQDAPYFMLRGMSQLRDLDLSGNQFRDAAMLGGLRELRRLNLSNTLVRADEVRMVINLAPGLTSLGLNGVQVGNISNLGDFRNPQSGQVLDLTELDLGNTGLLGSNGNRGFEFLQQFPNLQRLNLAGNAITDLSETIPLGNLRELDVSNNRLSTLPPGQSTSLARLNLSGNPLQDLNGVRQWINQCPSLTSLGLNGVAISDFATLGPLFDNRTGRAYNLTELDLGNTGIKDGSGNGSLNFLQPFVNLRKLNVANNGVNDASVLGNLPQLDDLDLSGNQLPGVNYLNPLRNLTRLNLSGNRNLLIDDVANTLLMTNPGLTSIGLNGIRIGQNTQWLNQLGMNMDRAASVVELDLGNTALDAVALQSMVSFVNLRRLNLANNHFAPDTNFFALREARKLQDLDLSGNQFIDLYALAGLTELRRINLSNSNVRVEDVRAMLDHNPNLASIKLNGVAIGNISNLGELRNRQTWQYYNLTELDLGNTGLRGSYYAQSNLGFDFLNQFPNLVNLNLAGNGIDDLPEIRNLNRLQQLDISNNRLHYLLLAPSARLTHLNLSGNTQFQVRDVRDVIAQNPELTSLGLNGIQIGNIGNLGNLNDYRTGRPYRFTALDFGNTGLLDQNGQKSLAFLNQFPQLQRLNLAGNGLSNVAELGMLAQLQDLDLSNNAIPDVGGLSNLRKLSRLILSGNPGINPLPLQALIDQSVNLTSLGLNGIALRDISALGPMTNRLTGRPYNLTELDLGNTQLNANGNTSTYWLAQFPGLERLNLAGNGIERISGLEMARAITQLDLSNNALREIWSLMSLRSLTRLNLSGNVNLAGPDAGSMVRQNPGLTHIGLNGINLGSLNNVGGFGGNWQPMKLVELDIGNTQMSDLDGLNFLPSFPGITRLNVAGNGLRSINGVRNHPGLRNLDVSNNALTMLGDLYGSQTLQTLNLAGNTGLYCADLDHFVSQMSNIAVTRPATCLSLNLPPVADAGANQTVNEGSVVTLSGSATDPDGNIAHADWVQIAGPNVSLTSPDQVASGFTAPPVTSETVFSFRLTVVDDKGASATSTTNVLVKPVLNVPPLASAGANQSVLSGDNVLLSGSASDSDGSIAGYDWLQTAGPAVVLTTPKTASSGFVAPLVSSDTVFTFQLTVQDNKGASASNTTNVTVKAKPNLPPVANAGSTQTVVAGSNVTLAGSATDSDGSIASYGWVQTAGPAVTLSAPKAASTGFVAPALAVDSVLTFQLTVTDNKGATATSSVSITVKAKPNLPPVASAGSAQTVVGGATVTLNGSGTDSDGSIASYAWSQTAGAAVVLSAPKAATTTFVAPLVSVKTVFTFQMTVVDNRGGSAVSSVSITVNPKPNDAPVANAGASQVVVEGNSVSLTGSGTDSDGTIASYKWTQTAGTAVTLATSTAASTTFVAPQVNADTVLSFKLTVTDNKGAVATATTSVTVQNTPDLSLTALSSNLSRVARGASITVTSGIKNGSTKATAADTVTGLYLSKVSGTVKTTDQLLGTVLIPAGLVSGTTSSNATRVVIPANLAPGVYYLGGIADSTDTVLESNESNNTRMGTQITVF